MSKKDDPTIPTHELGKHDTQPIGDVDPLVGHRIAGRYELLQALAKGGFGKVYKARDIKLERIVAIKLVDPGPGASDDTRSRMLREARANARLHHPNVVVLYDAGEDPFGLYLVLEYIAGTSLADVLGNGPIEPYRAAEIARECASALGAAHAHGIVHRDIKPGNILLTESGRVKVADFGVARLMGEARLTDRGSIIGTPNYMSPEQIDGSEVGPEADMFALGCVLYEMLAGRPPFDGQTTSEVLGRILRGSADPLPPLDHTVAPLVDAIASLLEKTPERRLRPNELTERLRSWERSVGGPKSRAPRRGMRAAIVVATIALAAVIGATLALRDREPAKTPPPDPLLLIRVADVPTDSGALMEKTIRFSSRDALFAYIEFLGRDRAGFKRVDERTVSLEGNENTVRMRAEEASVFDQLLGHEFFREPSLFTTGEASTSLVSCDFQAVPPSELIALFAAAAGWPVVQAADAPLESSALLRVSAEDQPWDQLLESVMRAAGLASHRYETIWLVTSEDVPVVSRSNVLTIYPRRYSTTDLMQRAEGAVSDRGIVMATDKGGRDGLIVVDSIGGIEAVRRAVAEVRGPDWRIFDPRRFTGPPITLRLNGAPLRDVLDFYGNLTKRPHVVAGDVTAFVRANIVEVPSDEYLSAVLDANGLTTFEADSGVTVSLFDRETIEIRLENSDGTRYEPLGRLAEHFANLTGGECSIEASGSVVRITGRNDVARDLANIVRAIDHELE